MTTVSGCDRELNAHFYSAASLKYHAPDTWHGTTPSHIILTLVEQSELYPVILSAKRGATSTIFNDFGMSLPRLQPVISRSPKRTLYHLSYWGRSDWLSHTTYSYRNRAIYKLRYKFGSVYIRLN